MEINSLKSRQLNYILDKIGEKKKLTKKEANFLDSFENIDDSYFSEFGMLTDKDVAEKIKNILSADFDVICNLCDSMGPLNLKIIDVYESGNKIVLLLEKNDSFDLEDNHFYDLCYDIKYCRFSLESNNEYYELVPIKND